MVLTLGALVSSSCSAPGPEASAEEQYAYYCLRCHGPDGRGTPEQLEQNPKNDLSISEMLAAGRRQEVRERISQGYGPMPGLEGKVDEGVIDKLTSYSFELIASHARQSP